MRKRVSKNLEPYPARSSWKRALDVMIIFIGVIGPLLTIPQILLIYGDQQAAGVSAISWFGWATLNIPWILYGIAHKEPPIVMTYCLWFLTNNIVAIGALLYG